MSFKPLTHLVLIGHLLSNRPDLVHLTFLYLDFQTLMLKFCNCSWSYIAQAFLARTLEGPMPMSSPCLQIPAPLHALTLVTFNWRLKSELSYLFLCHPFTTITTDFLRSNKLSFINWPGNKTDQQTGSCKLDLTENSSVHWAPHCSFCMVPRNAFRFM